MLIDCLLLMMAFKNVAGISKASLENECSCFVKRDGYCEFHALNRKLSLHSIVFYVFTVNGGTSNEKSTFMGGSYKNFYLKLAQTLH